MAEWWNSLDLLGQIYGIIAIPSTLILLLQTILLFFGIGDSGVDGGIDLNGNGIPDTPGDFDGDGGMTVFSIRGIVAMLTVGAWSGLAMHQAGWNTTLTIILSLIFGFVALLVMGFVMYKIMSLQISGNIDIGMSVGKTGKVYIPIPANMQGSGKITLTLQEKFLEADAVTMSSRKLKTGEAVRIVATDEAGTLVVEPIASENDSDAVELEK